MPDPNQVKEIIDSGAYAVGHILCVNGTLPWRLGEGYKPDRLISSRYVAACKEVDEAAEAFVADMMREQRGGA
jgi:hypothetical protein